MSEVDNTITMKKEEIANNVQHTSQPTVIQIRNVSELSLEKIEELRKQINLAGVQICDGANTNNKREQSMVYKIADYITIRKIIDKLVSRISMPAEDNPDREKIIVSQVYVTLGKAIKYDYTNAEKGNQRTPTCGNMYGALIDKTCVCAGYADTLRNVLACLGIEARYTRGQEEIEEMQESQNEKQTIKTSGHAWNQVQLDGEWFNVDLTWDSARMQQKKSLRFFLKSDDDFGHEKYSAKRNSYRHLCPRTISGEEFQSFISEVRELKKELLRADITAQEVVEATDELEQDMKRARDKGQEKYSDIER